MEPGVERSIGAIAARVYVVVAGAAVLVVETLAARLVAPYVGLTIESFSAAIGVALLGIALGAEAGGRLADRIGPRFVIAGGFALGGLLVFTIRPIVLGLGPSLAPGPGSALFAVAVSTLAPVLALSTVPPAVAKSRLARLQESGRVVGSLSAYGTLGALAGTLLTGFVFVATLPTGAILAWTGSACLVLAPAPFAFRPRRLPVVTVLAAVLGSTMTIAPRVCDVETRYYCARVVADPSSLWGRTLFLDDLPHSYVDIRDPTVLEFTYIQRFADVFDSFFEPDRVLEVLHLGGGAFTIPRWLAATRPGTRSTVLEIDRAVVDLGRRRLAVGEIPDMDVIIGDARTSVRRLRADSVDAIVGDAFGSRSVPWHLATREFLADVRRVLRPGGVLMLNVIDFDPNAFLRAEVATVARVFDQVAVLARADQLEARGGGNFVVVASDDPLPDAALRERMARREGGEVIRDIDALTEGAEVLTDDFAPVDQLLTPYRPPPAANGPPTHEIDDRA